MAQKIALLLVSALALGCGDNATEGDSDADLRLVCGPDSACDDAFDESLTGWLETGADRAGRYTYVSSFSDPSGYHIATEIDVEAGVVVARRATGVRPDGPSLVAFSWQEAGDEVGIHTEGPRAVPISTLYEECTLDILAQDTTANEVVLERFATGALKSCTFRPHTCTSSRAACTFGPSITSIDLSPR